MSMKPSMIAMVVAAVIFLVGAFNLVTMTGISLGSLGLAVLAGGLALQAWKM